LAGRWPYATFIFYLCDPFIALGVEALYLWDAEKIDGF
jgi:hypothetical protein